MNNFCPSCGEPRKEGAAFCSECGKPYADSAAPAAPAVSAAPSAPATESSDFVRFIKIAAPYLLIVVLILSIISAVTLIPSDDKTVTTAIAAKGEELVKGTVSMEEFVEDKFSLFDNNHLLPMVNIVGIVMLVVAIIASLIGIINGFAGKKNVSLTLNIANNFLCFGSLVYIFLLFSILHKQGLIFGVNAHIFVIPDTIILVSAGFSLVLNIVMSIYNKILKTRSKK